MVQWGRVDQNGHILQSWMGVLCYQLDRYGEGISAATMLLTTFQNKPQVRPCFRIYISLHFLDRSGSHGCLAPGQTLGLVKQDRNRTKSTIQFTIQHRGWIISGYLPLRDVH